MADQGKNNSCKPDSSSDETKNSYALNISYDEPDSSYDEPDSSYNEQNSILNPSVVIPEAEQARAKELIDGGTLYNNAREALLEEIAGAKNDLTDKTKCRLKDKNQLSSAIKSAENALTDIETKIHNAEMYNADTDVEEEKLDRQI